MPHQPFNARKYFLFYIVTQGSFKLIVAFFCNWNNGKYLKYSVHDIPCYKMETFTTFFLCFSFNRQHRIFPFFHIYCNFCWRTTLLSVRIRFHGNYIFVTLTNWAQGYFFLRKNYHSWKLIKIASIRTNSIPCRWTSLNQNWLF